MDVLLNPKKQHGQDLNRILYFLWHFRTDFWQKETKKIVNVLQDVMILHKRCSLSGKDNHLLKNHFYKLHKVLRWDLLVSEKNNSDLNYQNSFLKRFSLNSKLTQVSSIFLGKAFSSFPRRRRLFLFFRWSHIRCYKVHTISYRASNAEIRNWNWIK